MNTMTWKLISDPKRTNNAVFLIDLKSQSFCYVNDYACKKLGYSRHELLSLRIQDIDPLINDASLLKIAEQIAQQGFSLFETYHLTKDGHLFPVEVSGNIFEYQGESFGISVARDLTERKQNDGQLALLDYAFNHVDEAMFLIDENAQFIQVNEKACSSLGYSCEELLGMSIFDIDPDYTRQHWKQNLNNIAKGIRLETRHRTKDGRIFPIEIVSNRICYQGQNYKIAMARDITERKAAEKQLALLNYALDHIKEEVWLIDEHARFHYVNQKACRSIGRPYQEMLQLTVPDIKPDYGLEQWQQDWQRIKTTGSSSFETSHQSKERGVFPVEVNANYFEFDGESYSLTLSHDITERKQKEAQLALLDYAFNYVDEGIFLINSDAQFLQVNEKACLSLGYSREELLSMSIFDIDPDCTPELWQNLLAEHEKGRKSITIETRHRSKDGVVFPVEVRGHYIAYQGQKYSFAMVRDMTERKAAENQLTLLNYALDHVKESVWLMDENAKIHYVNQEACHSVGYTHEELLQLDIPDIDADFPMAKWHENWQELKTRKTLRFETAHKTKEGRIFPVEVNANYFEFGGKAYNLALSHDITERKRMENELVAREHEFRTLAENVPDNLLRYDLQCRLHYMNPATMLNLAAEAMPVLGKTPSQSFPNNPVAKNIQHGINHAIETGKACDMEIPWLNSNGEIGEHHIRCVAERDSEGTITGALMIGRDITGRKRMENELVAREREFRTLAENVPGILIRYDEKCRMRYVNQRLREDCGEQNAPKIGQTLIQAYPNDPLFAELHEIIRKVIETGQPAEIEKYFPHHQGGGTWTFSYVAESDDKGNIIGALALGQDISERKRMEEIIRQREREFRILIETSPAPIFRYDTNCRRIYVNPAVEQMTGKTAAELLNRVPSDASVLSQSEGAKLENVLRQVIQTGQAAEGEIECVIANGETHYYYNRYAPELDAEGKVLSVILVALDITERKHAEQLLYQREQEFRTLVDNLPTTVLRYDRHLQCIYANLAYLQMTGCSETALQNKSIDDVWCATNLSVEAYKAILHKVMRDGEKQEVLLEWTDRNGELICHALKIVPEYALNGQIQSVLALGFDFSEQRRQQLIETNRQRVFEKMARNNDLVAILEQVALYVESSKAGRYCAILVLDEDQHHLQLVAAPSFPDSYSAKSHALTLEVNSPHCLGWATSASYKQRVIIENIRQHPCASQCQDFIQETNALACWSEPIISSANQLLGVVTLYLNSTGLPDENDLAHLLKASHLSAIAIERKRIEQLMQHQANYDVLTGLPNRWLFNDRLQEEIYKAERRGNKIAVLFIDLDHFKDVNDTLGHQIGDNLLIEAAQRIQDCVRKTDTVARLGGDEFVVILPELDSAPPVERIADAIIHVMTEAFKLGEYHTYISASIGIAVYPQDDHRADTLVSYADQAMYAAKQAGRNNFNFFARSMQEQAQQRLYLVNSLRDALEKNQFEVYYQPIIEVASGKAVKAEALLRWHHPVLGMVSPAVFIPLAEETDLIQSIGSWVFCQAADMAKRWNTLNKETQPCKVSINMSPRQLIKGNGDQIAIDYLQAIAVDSNYIVVEITEGLLLDNSPHITEKLERLRNGGIQLSLDDFGTGYSAMAYLKKFDINYLKIDRSFIRELETNPNDRAITEAIVVMAHRLGLKVIAEGVDTAGQCELLAAIGCEYIQGFFYAKPMAIETFLSYVLD